MFKRFLTAGCPPVYFDFTYSAPQGAITFTIVRYYLDGLKPALYLLDFDAFGKVLAVVLV